MSPLSRSLGPLAFLSFSLACAGAGSDKAGDGPTDSDPGATGGDDSGTDDGTGGGPDEPSLRWEVLSGVCSGGSLDFTDVPAGAMVIWFTDEVDGAWDLNPGLGMSSALDESSGTLSVPCGEGNSVGQGSEVRIALGYPAADLPAGDDLKVSVYRGTCAGSPLELGDDAPRDFAGLGFTYVDADGSAGHSRRLFLLRSSGN